MAAQKGIDMLIKVSSDNTSGGTMNTLAGIRSPSVSVAAQSIDVTSADDTSRWRQLLAGGIRSVTISGSGVFKDDTAIEDVRDNMMGSTEALAYLQFILPDWGTISGSFHCTSLETAGEHDGEQTFSMTFESAGDIAWAAA